jgi:hypothetical protein
MTNKISLRDYFASKAMLESRQDPYRKRAINAYKFADIMILIRGDEEELPQEIKKSPPNKALTIKKILELKAKFDRGEEDGVDYNITILNLKKCDLSDSNLSGINFCGDLKGSRSSINLNSANLQDCNLNGADMSRCLLTKCKLKGATFKSTKLPKDLKGKVDDNGLVKEQFLTSTGKLKR